ncbi:MAG: hypothetical protein WBM75_09830 [Polyangiales bacterium]
MAESSKNFSDRVREVMDAVIGALEGLLSPPMVPVPVRVRPPQMPAKRRR